MTTSRTHEIEQALLLATEMPPRGTDRHYDQALAIIAGDAGIGVLMDIPGVYDLLSAHYRAEILAYLADDTPECAECGSLGSQACSPDCITQRQPDTKED